MNIIGFSLGYCSTIAYSENGEIKACISEERFSRKKNDERFPIKSLNYIKKKYNLKNKKIDAVVIASKKQNINAHLTRQYSTWSVEDHVEAQYSFWKPYLYGNKKVNYFDVLSKKIDYDQYPYNFKEIKKSLSSKNYFTEETSKVYKNFINKLISKELNISQNKIKYLDHHSCHAAYAFFGSNLKTKDTAIMTADAFGDGYSFTISKISKDMKITRVHKISEKQFTLARLYRYITLILNMKPSEHEYKVMGLSAYSKKMYYKKTLSIFRSIFKVDGINIKFINKPKDYYFHFLNIFKSHRFDNIAGALQEFTEEIMSKLTTNVLKKFKLNKIAYSGGISMNIKANMKIHELQNVQNIAVPASGGDESLAIGACYKYLNDLSFPNIKRLSNVYLGYSYTNKDEENFIKKIKNTRFKITKYNKTNLAKKISKGKVVARCVGNAEFGSRALGNRSIIADPRSFETVEKINEKIKNRDFWMPFAPSFLYEKVNNYIVNPKNIYSPYMTIGFESKKNKRKVLSAVIHQADKTLRPQMLKRENNPDYYDLIKEFSKITGVDCVLNTSLNLHGYPIVNNLNDALYTFKNSGLDILVTKNYIIEKNENW